MRLIDKEALKRDFAFMVAEREVKSSGGFISSIFEMTEEFFLLLLEKQPTIEANPIVHAHWMKDKFGESYCSKCYVYAVIDEDGRERKSKYCPCCGAQMDEKEEE